MSSVNFGFWLSVTPISPYTGANGHFLLDFGMGGAMRKKINFSID